MKQRHLIFLLSVCALLAACGEKQIADKSASITTTSKVS